MRAPLQLQGQFLIVAAAQAYEVILPGGGWRKQLSQHWLRDTVPHQAGRLLERVKDNEGPGPYWNALNFTGRFDLVTYPSVIWGGVRPRGGACGRPRSRRSLRSGTTSSRRARWTDSRATSTGAGPAAATTS